MSNLLFEIGCEELPAGYIRSALTQMQLALGRKLKDSRLNFNKIDATGTPRRLTVFVDQLEDKQENIVKEIMGPSCKVAFDNKGNPSNAGKGFAKSQGIDIKELKTKETEKGEYCYAIKKLEGECTIKLLPEILIWLIKSIEFPKRMTWKSKDFSFARPIRTLAAIFGSETVNFEINGIKSGRTVMGNPYITSPETYGKGNLITLENADYTDYKKKLATEKVIVDIDERKRTLHEKAQKILSKYNSSFEDEDLLEELTNLVEYPTAIECKFDEAFLELPEEVTISAMKGHQRYCPIIGDNGKLRSSFVSVLNMDEKNAVKAKDGNERVLRARLADAKFFLEEDKKISLYDRVEDLKGVTYQKQLGNLMDRTNRLVKLAGFIANVSGYSNDVIESAKRAAYLCKADLTTAMVGEFPELQGVMGRTYAICSGESKAVSNAIEDHYLPRFANDKLPETEIGTVVSLADKIDTVCGCFSIDLIPTGSQDPYALRRNVQGFIRIVEHGKLHLSIKTIVNHALSLLPVQKNMDKILDFFKDRLNQMYIDRGYRYDIINATLASGIDNIIDLSKRLQTVSELAKEDLWLDLVTVVERTFNISRNETLNGDVNPDLLIEPEEKKLWNTFNDNREKINSFIKEGNYKEASTLYRQVFSEPVHAFFDKVFVNVEDKKIKNNRLTMLKKVNEIYSNNIADLSKIVVEQRKW